MASFALEKTYTDFADLFTGFKAKYGQEFNFNNFPEKKFTMVLLNDGSDVVKYRTLVFNNLLSYIVSVEKFRKDPLFMQQFLLLPAP